WGTTGRYLAFVTRVMQPLPSWDLMMLPLEEENSTKINAGVFMGYGFTPRDERLLFRANCVPSGKSCDLFYRDPRQRAEAPKKIAEGVYSFKYSAQGQ